MTQRVCELEPKRCLSPWLGKQIRLGTVQTGRHLGLSHLFYSTYSAEKKAGVRVFALQTGVSCREKVELHFDRRLVTDLAWKSCSSWKNPSFPKLGVRSYGSSECSSSPCGPAWQHWQSSVRDIPDQGYYKGAAPLLQHIDGQWWTKLLVTAESPKRRFIRLLCKFSELYPHLEIRWCEKSSISTESGFVLSQEVPPTAADLGGLQLQKARRWRRTSRSVKNKEPALSQGRGHCEIFSARVTPQISVDV